MFHYRRFISQLLSVGIILGVSATPLCAKDFGRQGALFEIGEIDMLAWINARLKHLEQTGQTAAMQARLLDNAEKSVRRPTPVEGLGTTTTPRRFFIDPSLTLGSDVKDEKGNILYAKGLTINPFDSSTWPMGLNQTQFEYAYTVVFFDGDDPLQRAWAKQFTSEKPVKWTLTGGSPEQIATLLDSRTYFDQGGHYSKQFQLTHIPAIIEQDGKRWKVTEVDVTPYGQGGAFSP
ncbi:type-F conjugative transfer system protein TraW [Enterovibrio norvegicus]|uniref:Type-F conjugative transfer system protein TraW n=1 Tax=Enterovibrio norvegicus TaxID=188144 RepID=A0ABV4L6R4_9GAMM